MFHRRLFWRNWTAQNSPYANDAHSEYLPGIADHPLVLQQAVRSRYTYPLESDVNVRSSPRNPSTSTPPFRPRSAVLVRSQAYSAQASQRKQRSSFAHVILLSLEMPN